MAGLMYRYIDVLRSWQEVEGLVWRSCVNSSWMKTELHWSVSTRWTELWWGHLDSRTSVWMRECVGRSWWAGEGLGLKSALPRSASLPALPVQLRTETGLLLTALQLLLLRVSEWVSSEWRWDERGRPHFVPRPPTDASSHHHSSSIQSISVTALDK